MQHRDQIIIKKIIDEIDCGFKILGETNKTQFLESETLKHAIAMVEINIGELVKALTEEFKQETSHIPWRDIAGMRDIAAHKYQSINFERVYDTLFQDFNELRNNLRKII